MTTYNKTIKNNQSNLKGMYGIAYSCSTRENTYCDDWFTNRYSNIYKHNNQRNLKLVKQLGFNHIRTYYLKPEENHNEFLQHCSELNLSIEIGISNDLLQSRDFKSITKIVNSTKSFSCVKIYTVGNEYFGNTSDIIFGLDLIYSLDNNKYLMHSSIFDEGFYSAKKIVNALSKKSGILDRYIVSVNMYFYNNRAESHGDIVQNVVRDFYNDSILRNNYLIISEFGNNSRKNGEQYNSLWNFSFGNLECLKKYEKYLGYCLFGFVNESWKGTGQGEDNYGILEENGDKKNGYYAIENFKNIEEFRKYIR